MDEKQDKAAALADLAEEMEADRDLQFRGQANLVFGEGNPDCEVMFVGEAPGHNEDVEKRPFVGRAGQLLRQTLREAGWKEADVYITNIVKRRPPENRDPSPEEIFSYKPYLTRQIQIIKPKVIVALGRFSMNYFLPEAKITRDNGKMFRVNGQIVVPVLHPAAALRSPDVMQTFKKTVLGLPGRIARLDQSAAAPSAQARTEPAKTEPPSQKHLF